MPERLGLFIRIDDPFQRIVHSRLAVQAHHDCSQPQRVLVRVSQDPFRLGANRHRAASLELPQQRALGQAGQRGPLVRERPQHRQRRRVALADLEAERPLADGVVDAAVLGAEVLADAVLQAHALQPGRRHDHARVLALWAVHLGEPRVDVAAQVGEAQVRVEAPQLGGPAHRRGAHDGALGQRLQAGVRQPGLDDEGVACVVARGDDG